METLDTFASEWYIRKSWRNLPKDFFSTRVQPEGGHLKAFAGEVLLAIPILAMFGMMVLQPAGFLAENTRCMQLMARILAILESGDEAARHLSELTTLIQQHARAFVPLYDDLAKPKFHWLFHVPRCLQRFGNCSCFAPERKHKVVKTSASIAWGDHLDQNIALRACSEMLRCMQEACLTATSLLPPVIDLPWAVDLLSDMVGDAHVQKVERSQSMKVKHGTLLTDDIIFCRAATVVLQMKCYLRAWCRNGDCRYFAHASMHEHKGSNVFARGGVLGLVAWSDDFAPRAASAHVFDSHVYTRAFRITSLFYLFFPYCHRASMRSPWSTDIVQTVTLKFRGRWSEDCPEPCEA